MKLLFVRIFAFVGLFVSFSTWRPPPLRWLRHLWNFWLWTLVRAASSVGPLFSFKPVANGLAFEWKRMVIVDYTTLVVLDWTFNCRQSQSVSSLAWKEKQALAERDFKSFVSIWISCQWCGVWMEMNTPLGFHLHDSFNFALIEWAAADFTSGHQPLCERIEAKCAKQEWRRQNLRALSLLFQGTISSLMNTCC